jgi:hypothetical protein
MAVIMRRGVGQPAVIFLSLIQLKPQRKALTRRLTGPAAKDARSVDFCNRLERERKRGAGSPS